MKGDREKCLEEARGTIWPSRSIPNSSFPRCGWDCAEPSEIMISNDTVNVLLVDDQPAKLLAYEVILQELGENLIKTASAREAFECLLKNDVAVVLVDVCMPELDGFQLERQTLLVREVDHRARNALAVVQSIVRLTRAESKEAYIASVEERITALSRAHVLLSESRWQGANLSRLLDEELAPYRKSETEKIVTNGPAAFLEPATAQILALTLHELATNAAKYGALSSTVGRVRLSWHEPPGVAVGRDRWPVCPAAAFRRLWH
jgi:two-component sensor histidine kinase